MSKICLFVCDTLDIGGETTILEEIIKRYPDGKKHILLMAGSQKNIFSKHLNISQNILDLIRFQWDPYKNDLFFLHTFIEIYKTISRVTHKYPVGRVYINNAWSGMVACIHPKLWKIKKYYIFHADDSAIGLSQYTPPKRHKILGWIKRLKKGWISLFILNLSMRLVLFCSKKIFVYSQYSQEILREKYNINKSKIKYFPLGVDSSVFKRAQSKMHLNTLLGIKQTTNMLLCTSRFERRKGIHLLLDALPAILRRYPDTLLYLTTPRNEELSTNCYWAELHQRVHQSDISSSVHILYNLNRNELVPYYQAADLFVFPSVGLETFGLVVLESLACGTPVICSAQSGAPTEIISRISKQLIYNENTAESISACALSALNKKKQLKMYADRGYSYTKTYDWDKSAKLLYQKSV